MICRSCEIDKGTAFEPTRKVCNDCRSAQKAARYQKARDDILAKRKLDYAADPQKFKDAEKLYRDANPDIIKARDAAKYQRRKDKVKACVKVWVIKNRGRQNANNARRYASKKQQTPTWADQAAIVSIYDNCPQGCEVDHVIPLRGKYVSGLHVHYNLQYLTIEENRMKRNTYKPEF